jgi:hypothetical protein
MDVATGSGDVPTALDARARSAGIRIEWTLCDRSPHALARAHNEDAEEAVEQAVNLGLAPRVRKRRRDAAERDPPLARPARRRRLHEAEPLQPLFSPLHSLLQPLPPLPSPPLPSPPLHSLLLLSLVSPQRWYPEMRTLCGCWHPLMNL